ncbi:MAG: hypothetical protein AAFV53_21965 [Myxococcota bacterium]
MILLFMGLATADAAEHHLVRPGQTFTAIARQLGDPELADEIAQLNQMDIDAVLTPGTLIDVPTTADAVTGPPAQIASLKGSGQLYLPPNARALPIRIGQDLPPDTLVCTDDGSFVRIRLTVQHDTFLHDEVSLMPSTCLRIAQLVSRPDGRKSTLVLANGSVSVRETDGRGELILLSEDGVTTGAQGGFRVTREEGATRTEATNGRVAVLSGGQEVRLDPGEGSRTRRGLPPTPATALLPAGALDRPKPDAILYRADFIWRPVPGALGYRIEIAADSDFTDLLVVEDVDHTRWEPELLFLPTARSAVWWRVSAFDRAGFQGLSDEIRTVRYPTGVGTQPDPASPAPP